jgi:hypothetical protein
VGQPPKTECGGQKILGLSGKDGVIHLFSLPRKPLRACSGRPSRHLRCYDVLVPVLSARIGRQGRTWRSVRQCDRRGCDVFKLRECGVTIGVFWIDRWKLSATRKRG